MSVRVMSLVLSRKIGSPARKLILLKLADCAHDDGSNAYPSLSRVADETETSRGTVKRAIRSMISDGLISVDHHGGGHPGSTNVYRLNLTAIEALEPSHEPRSKMNPVQNEPGPNDGGWGHSGPGGGLTVTPNPSLEPSFKKEVEDARAREMEPLDDRHHDSQAPASDHDAKDRPAPGKAEGQNAGGNDRGQPPATTSQRAEHSGDTGNREHPRQANTIPYGPFTTDWWPDEYSLGHARRLGCPDPEAEAEYCRDTRARSGRPYFDHNAEFRAWCTRAAKGAGWLCDRSAALAPRPASAQTAPNGGQRGGYSNAGDRSRETADRMFTAASNIVARREGGNGFGATGTGSSAVPVVDLAEWRSGGSGGR